MNKKAEFEFYSDWAELFFLVLLVVGIIIGIFSPSAIMTYLISLICGMMSGRLLFDRKDKGRSPFFLIVIGFLIGFLIGAYLVIYVLKLYPYGDIRVVFVIFLLGAWLMYYLWDKKILSDKYI